MIFLLTNKKLTQQELDIFQLRCFIDRIVYFSEISNRFNNITIKISKGCETYGEYVRLINDFIFEINYFASNKEKVILFLSSVNPIFSFLLSQKAALLVPNVDVVFSNTEFHNLIEVLL